MKGTYVELGNKVLILLTVDWMSSMAAVWAEFFPYSWRPLPRPVWKLDVSSSRKMYPQDSSDISTTKMISRMDEYYGGKENHLVIYIIKLHNFGNLSKISAFILVFRKYIRYIFYKWKFSKKGRCFVLWII